MGSPGASNLGYVPMAASTGEDVDACVDSEFRMVMRKLMKRDSVTKLKVINTETHKYIVQWSVHLLIFCLLWRHVIVFIGIIMIMIVNCLIYLLKVIANQNTTVIFQHF